MAKDEGFESELELIPALVKRAKLQGISSVEQLADKLGFSFFDTEMALAEDTLELSLDLAVIQWLQVRLSLGFSHKEAVEMLIKEERKIRTAANERRAKECTAYNTVVSPKKTRKRRKATNPKPPSSLASSSALQPYIYLLPDSPKSGS